MNLSVLHDMQSHLELDTQWLWACPIPHAARLVIPNKDRDLANDDKSRSLLSVAATSSVRSFAPLTMTLMTRRGRFAAATAPRSFCTGAIAQPRNDALSR